MPECCIGCSPRAIFQTKVRILFKQLVVLKQLHLLFEGEQYHDELLSVIEFRRSFFNWHLHSTKVREAAGFAVTYRVVHAIGRRKRGQAFEFDPGFFVELAKANSFHFFSKCWQMCFCFSLDTTDWNKGDFVVPMFPFNCDGNIAFDQCKHQRVRFEFDTECIEVATVVRVFMLNGE